MKKARLFVKIFLVVALGYFALGYFVRTYRINASRSLSPLQRATYSYNGLDIQLTYCSPSKKGRVIFGDSSAGALVPNGKYWRLGANNSTEITFSKDVKIQGQDLKAGSYRLYAVPSSSSWHVVFNSELGTWGYDEPNYDLDVLKVEVPVEKTQSAQERFKVSFSSEPTTVNMNLDWDKTHVRVPIVVQ